MTNLPQRRRLSIDGRVQGVGFRPFVLRLASELNLGGCVGNDSRGAFIEVEGPPLMLDSFEEQLVKKQPPLASIASVERSELTPRGETVFYIAQSEHRGAQTAEVTPDAALCDACREELLTATDRRYHYPFINCTDCGPRYSIIEAVPYDRPSTTMAQFTMCADCQGEYDEAGDRRFHAQPNACPRCGPQVWLQDAQGTVLAKQTDAIAMAAERLWAGEIVAIKGLGGVHLACRADDHMVVSTLRERKSREAKPLALMVASVEQAQQLVLLDAHARRVLCSPAAPIVLAPRRPGILLAPAVASDSDFLGLLLPYTPLHELLFVFLAKDRPAPPLVMTSGNPSEEPLSAENDDALKRLSTIADCFLLHDRDIERPIDDSIVMTLPQGAPLTVRRARGYVPNPIMLEERSPHTVLALGGDLKATICLLSETRAVLSEHLGDLENPAAYRNYLAAIERLQQLTQLEPQLLAHDLHPGYHSTNAAKHFVGLPTVGVQHHHAHAVACMAENGLGGEVVAICCDGTGYGDDGAIWGGEILTCDRARYRRVGQLAYFPLFGGDAASRQTWRAAAGVLDSALGEDWVKLMARSASEAEQFSIAKQRMKTAPRTSSLGRLFDAMAFLLGIAGENRFEGDAAVALENAARRCEQAPVVQPMLRPMEREGRLMLDHGPLVLELVQARAAGVDTAQLAMAFHLAVAQGFAAAALTIANGHGISQVVLSGGCFLNRILLRAMQVQLEDAGLKVHRHHHLPPGDGGLALGQAVVAAHTSPL